MNGVLAKVRIVFRQFKPVRRVALVFGRNNIVLAIFGANQADDFSGFAFLFRHLGFLATLSRIHKYARFFGFWARATRKCTCAEP